MLVSLVFQFTSQLMLLFHLWTYSFDGEGVLPADILAKIFSAISEIIMSMLLI
jgi:Rhodopsin-like GPCR transmembrane domain